MATRVMLSSNWFWVENNLMDRKDLCSHEKLLYIALSRYANRDGKCYPSHRKLLEVTGIKDVRTIQKYLKKLVEKDFIVVFGKKGRSNIYLLKNIPSFNAATTNNVATFVAKK